MSITRYTANIAGSQATWAAFAGWAGGSSGGYTGMSYILGQLGFTLKADPYTAQWSNPAQLLPNGTVAGLNGTAFPTVANTARTALAAGNFLGVWQQGAYVAGDVVIWTPASSPALGETGLVYICVATTTNVPNEIPSNTTFWSPYYMEIWEMTGSQTPVYIKMEYGGSSTAATDPMMTMQIGTGWNSNGSLTGNVTLTELLFNGSGTIAATECDFCGDGQNFFVANWFRGGAANPGPAIFGWERAISGTVSGAPVYNSAYVSYIKGYAAAGNWWQQTLFLSGGIPTATRVNYGNTVTLGAATGTLVVNNTTPALPVFPLLGYCGNPFTILIAQQEVDTLEGTTVGVANFYGRTNNYVMTKTTFALAFAGTGQTASYAVGTRFDAS